MLLLYIFWDDWPIFMISASNEQLQQQLEYTLLKSDCHRRWISKMQSDTLEERYAIKFCFKLGKMPQKCMECFRLLLKHLAWIEHQFLSGIRDSRKAWSLWGMMRSVGGVRKSMHQSWLAKRLGLGLLCWCFKGVQQEILWEGPALFESGQWHFHQENAPVDNSILVTDYLTKTGIKTVPPLPIVQTLLLVTFGYSLNSEAFVMRQLRRRKRLWRRSLTHLQKRTSMGSSRSCWNGTTSGLQLEEIT